jgi:hypothetical protein
MDGGLVLIVGAALGFLPWIVAGLRSHRNVLAIGVLNAGVLAQAGLMAVSQAGRGFAGNLEVEILFLVWIGALSWSTTQDRQPWALMSPQEREALRLQTLEAVTAIPADKD